VNAFFHYTMIATTLTKLTSSPMPTITTFTTSTAARRRGAAERTACCERKLKHTPRQKLLSLHKVSSWFNQSFTTLGELVEELPRRRRRT
jgi:hypothetical protein